MRRERRPVRAAALLVFLLVSAGTGVVAISQGWISPSSIQEAAAEAGATAWFVYVAAMVTLELLWVPRAWGLLAGGALFGPITGSLLSICADMISAILCFGLGRGGAGEWVKGVLSSRPKASRIVDLLAKKRGAVSVAVLRIVPIGHFTAVSYAAGATGVRFPGFVLGTALGIIPGAILYPYVGHAALDPTSPAFFVSVGLLVTAFVVTAFLARKLFRE